MTRDTQCETDITSSSKVRDKVKLWESVWAPALLPCVETVIRRLGSYPDGNVKLRHDGETQCHENDGCQ